MASQWHLYSHIMESRLVAHTSFYREGAKLIGLDPYCPEAARPDLFFKVFRSQSESEPLLRHLLFGGEHFSFLERVIEPFGCSFDEAALYGRDHSASQLILEKIQSHYAFWRGSCFFRAYLANISSYFFDPKGVGGNIPGLVLKEELQYANSKVPVYWSATPTPFKGREVAPEADSLLSLWKKTDSKSLLVYCNLQSLCHRSEQERSLKLLSFARHFPDHMRFLQITVDSPLYLEMPKVLSLEEQCREVVRELSKKESFYRTSLSSEQQALWVTHAIDVAESTKQWVQKKSVKNGPRVFMELFSLSLARRWLGFSLATSPLKKEVFLIQACRECIDRGATLIFEQALSLSNLSVRELQALFWGRALLARGRLPYEVRMKGCRELFTAIDRKEVGVWLEEQLERGIGMKLLAPTRLSRYE